MTEKLTGPALCVVLPDGRKLIATDKDDGDYPGIQIELHTSTGQPETLVWVEYNTIRQDYKDGDRLRVIVWNQRGDEPAFNMSYHTGTLDDE